MEDNQIEQQVNELTSNINETKIQTIYQIVTDKKNIVDQAQFLKQLDKKYQQLMDYFQINKNIQIRIILIKLNILFHKNDTEPIFYVDIVNQTEFNQYLLLGNDYLLNMLLLYARGWYTTLEKRGLTDLTSINYEQENINIKYLKDGLIYLVDQHYYTEAYDYILESQNYNLILLIADKINQANFYNYAVSCLQFSDQDSKIIQLNALYNIYTTLKQYYICLAIAIQLHDDEKVQCVKRILVRDNIQLDAYYQTISSYSWISDNKPVDVIKLINDNKLQQKPIQIAEINEKNQIDVDQQNQINQEDTFMSSLINCMCEEPIDLKLQENQNINLDYALLLAANSFSLTRRMSINECLAYMNSQKEYIKAAGCLMLGINWRMTGNTHVIKILSQIVQKYDNRPERQQYKEEYSCVCGCALFAIGFVSFAQQNSYTNKFLMRAIQDSINGVAVLDKLGRSCAAVSLAMNNVGTSNTDIVKLLTRLIAGLSLNQRGIRFFPLILSSIYLLFNQYNKPDSELIQIIQNILDSITVCDSNDEKLAANSDDNLLLTAAIQTNLTCYCSDNLQQNLQALSEAIQGRVAAEEARNTSKFQHDQQSQREKDILEAVVSAGIPIFDGDRCLWWSETQDACLPLVLSQARRFTQINVKSYENMQNTTIDTDIFTKFDLQQKKYEILHLYQNLQLYGNELTKRAAPLMLGLGLNQTADQALLPDLISQATNIDSTISFNTMLAIGLIFAGSQDKKAIQAINYITECKYYSENHQQQTLFIRKIALGLIMLGQGQARLNLKDINRYNLLLLLLQFMGSTSEVMARAKGQLFLFILFLLVEPKYNEKDTEKLYQKQNQSDQNEQVEDIYE